MTPHLIYIGNLHNDAVLPLPPDIQCIARDDEAAILQTEDAPVAQQVARELDGLSLNGQTITAIERTRLETALNTTRMVRCSRMVVALATRLGLVKRDSQYCLQRLVALWGETPVINAADRAIQQAKTQSTHPSEIFFSLLLAPLHPLAAQALRVGSLLKAESRSRAGAGMPACQLVTDPVLIELERRQEIYRQARRELDNLENSGVVDKTKLARAIEKMNDADMDVKAFLERYDMPATLRQANLTRAIRARDITADNQ